ncbi:hypothetical protein [Streptomyces sp. NPDC007914]|uniref:hypothetical protein n=1 Tax=unclassified Streptomyces TaxID=2593676 RepID=UPI0036E14DF0
MIRRHRAVRLSVTPWAARSQSTRWRTARRAAGGFAPDGGAGCAALYAFTVSEAALTRADLTHANRPSGEDRS